VVDKYNLKKHMSIANRKSKNEKKQRRKPQRFETKNSIANRNPDKHARSHIKKTIAHPNQNKASQKLHQLQKIKQAWRRTKTKKELANPTNFEFEKNRKRRPNEAWPDLETMPGKTEPDTNLTPPNLQQLGSLTTPDLRQISPPRQPPTSGSSHSPRPPTPDTAPSPTPLRFAASPRPKERNEPATEMQV